MTPLDAAFTKPIAARTFGTMLEDKGVRLEPEFMLERVDPEAKALVSYDEREVPYDLLVTIPLNMGADFVARSGLGNELNLVQVDKQTLLSKKYDTIFALGDANDIPDLQGRLGRALRDRACSSTTSSTTSRAPR